MAQAIDHVHDGNQAGTITRASLLTAMEEAIQSFAKAFDVPLIKKLHWMLHLPDALTRYGTLPNCLQQKGALATNLQNQDRFEKHLLEQAIAKEISTLDQPDLFKEGVFLVNPKAASKKVLANLFASLQIELHQALTSHVAKVRGTTCIAGDVILYHVGNHVHPHWQVAEIKLHFGFQGTAMTMIHAWDLQSYVPAKQYASCKPSNMLGFIPTEDILVSVIWTQSSSEAKVLLPHRIYAKDVV